MACNAPLVAWYSKDKSPGGTRGITFDAKEALIDRPLNLPCGQCFGCRIHKAQQWGMRCAHEAQMHDDNCFITLTYAEKNLPKQNGIPTLRPQDFVNFMKRLRKRRNGKIKFFHCGEYGELGRPHHHVLLFNCDFKDKTHWRKSGEYNIYRSEELEKLWPYGHTEIGTATQNSASYIAKYQIKKGEKIEGRKPEYLTMSRRPGIGKTWLKKYMTDVYPTDEVITKTGKSIKPPRYYDQQLEKENQSQWQLTKTKRQQQQQQQQQKGKTINLLARETIHRAKAKLRSRTL